MILEKFKTMFAAVLSFLGPAPNSRYNTLFRAVPALNRAITAQCDFPITGIEETTYSPYVAPDKAVKKVTFLLSTPESIQII